MREGFAEKAISTAVHAIESALQQFSQVAESMCLSQEGGRIGSRLKAAVGLQSSGEQIPTHWQAGFCHLCMPDVDISASHKRIDKARCNFKQKGAQLVL